MAKFKSKSEENSILMDVDIVPMNTMEENSVLMQLIQDDLNFKRGIVQKNLTRMANKPDRVVVQFRDLYSKSDMFCLELGMHDPFNVVVGRVAEKLVVDPLRIRLTPHFCLSNTPASERNYFKSSDCLLRMLNTYRKKCNVLYCGVLAVPESDLQHCMTLKVSYGYPHEEIKVVLPKHNKVEDLLNDLKKNKVKLTNCNAKLKLFGIDNCKLHTVFPLNEKIEDIPKHLKLWADEVGLEVWSRVFKLFDQNTLSEGSSKNKHVKGLQMSQPTPTVTHSKDINELFIPYMAALVQSSDRSYWLPVTVWFGGLLSGRDRPVVKVLQSRVLPTLLLFLTEENDPELQVEAAKCIRYIAHGTSGSTKAHDALWHLLHSKDEVLRHACCSLGVLSGCENFKIRELVGECGLYNRLVELIRHPTLAVAALRTFGNMVEGNDYLIDCMIKDKVLVYLRSCLNHDHVDVRKEACWIISYITAGNGRWIQDVFEADLVEALVNLVMNDEFGVMEAAIQVISNATSGATREQIRFLVSRGCIEPLCYLFCCKNNKIFNLCLEGLENILEAGELEKINETDINPFVEYINNIEGAWEVLIDSLGNYEKKLTEKGFDILRRHGILPTLSNSMQTRLLKRKWL